MTQVHPKNSLWTKSVFYACSVQEPCCVIWQHWRHGEEVKRPLPGSVNRLFVIVIVIWHLFKLQAERELCKPRKSCKLDWWETGCWGWPIVFYILTRRRCWRACNLMQGLPCSKTWILLCSRYIYSFLVPSKFFHRFLYCLIMWNQ